MILAAGLGQRMRPLTDHTPKPLLKVAGVPLLEHHIRRLRDAGFNELVVNVSHMADQIVDYFGDGSRWGVVLNWSVEDEPLETAGGIVKALPVLGSAPFAVVNGDIWTDYPFAQLVNRELLHAEGAHLVMVESPPQHANGDFVLGEDGRLDTLEQANKGLTYSGVGIYSSGFFRDLPVCKYPLKPLLLRSIERGGLQGEYYRGDWVDVGTPERLDSLNRRLAPDT
ncbi:MAG: N-acetylmuramate alpha-1-phosphate uridylyltransferase MurU [Halioglobus sp.]